MAVSILAHRRTVKQKESNKNKSGKLQTKKGNKTNEAAAAEVALDVFVTTQTTTATTN